MKSFVKKLLPMVDLVLMPFVYFAALLLKNIRRAGIHRLPMCRQTLFHVTGVRLLRKLTAFNFQ